MKHLRLSSVIISLVIVFSLALSFTSCSKDNSESFGYKEIKVTLENKESVVIPGFSGDEYYILNGNKPCFTDSELVTESYEKYMPLDSLGRCTETMACIGSDIMPTEDRGDISSVTPSGWIQAKYDIISGKYLYNRSHLIGFQLTGENDTEENLITGTRFMNEAMIPFENQVADYIKETDNHVMYRVTPVFVGNDLLAAGVIMEAYSVEDSGDGICFNLFLYNSQPGVSIDYSTGRSWIGEAPSDSENSDAANDKNEESSTESSYILNTNSKKIHTADCGNAAKISEKNKQEYSGDISELVSEGYEKAGCCFD